MDNKQEVGHAYLFLIYNQGGDYFYGLLEDVLFTTDNSNSGIVIPKEKALHEELKANDRVTILLTKESDSLKVKDIFGSVRWKTPIKRMMDEIDKEFE